MYCSKCSSILSFGDKFCSKCGTTVTPLDDSNLENVKEKIISTPNNILVKNNTKELEPRQKAIIITCLLIFGTVFYFNAESLYTYEKPESNFESTNTIDKKTTGSVETQDNIETDTAYIKKDPMVEYASNLAKQLENSGHPGCQALASSIRMVGYSGNSTEIKYRQINSIVDSAPSICFLEY